jgi:CDP-glucose 4,6-dehydratase
MIRSFDQGQVLCLRYPSAVRPWQHVLDPLNGYLRLAEQMWQNGSVYAKGWNFGPGHDRPWGVMEVVREAARLWGNNAQWTVAAEDRLHEDNHLNIDASMARTQLKWEPKLDIKTALKWTIDWYRTHLNGGMDMRSYSLQQIERYESLH